MDKSAPLDRNIQRAQLQIETWDKNWKPKAEEALIFISHKIDEEFNTSGDEMNFQNQLKDGVKLCKLVNAMKPGTIQNEEYADTPTEPERQRKLIGLVIKGMKSLVGTQTFGIDDLHAAGNLPQCIQAICALQPKKK